jgi:FlgD Ig-like domain
MNRRFLPLFAILVASVDPITSYAQWASDGSLLSAGVSNQTGPQATPDGAGGAFVTWTDSRNGNLDIYAQLVNSNGVVEWVGNGLAVRSVAHNQSDPRIVPDNTGGAIVVWVEEENNGSTDIVAQRIDATGAAQWGVNAITICGAQNDQRSISAIPDGAGGAIFVWQDARGGSFMVADIYAQRVNSAGTILWAGDGVAVCIAADQQSLPVLASDGAGGAIFAWSDYRDGLTHDIYTRRVNAAGSLQWTADGVPACTAASEQDAPAATTDGAGGAIISWTDARDGLTDIYAQRVNGSGAPQWDGDGVVVCDATGSQNDPQIIAGASGGAVLTWNDARDAGTTDVDIYAQRVDGSGAAQWTDGGVALCTEVNTQLFARLTPAGDGGAVVTWIDTRTGGLNYDIYAQRIDASGAVQWTGNGVALCTASNGQLSPTIVTDGFGGAIVAWQDHRSGSTSDIYGNRITRGGMIPTAVGGAPALPSIVVGEGYPNPFSAQTTLDLTLPQSAAVRVELLDVRGRRVRVVDLGRVAAGTTSFSFDGRDAAGHLLPSGVYFCRVHAAPAAITRKLVIQR